MRHYALCTILLALSVPAWAGMVEDCNQSQDPALRIEGCKAVILSGEWQGKDLAAAYGLLGNAFRTTGDLVTAIESYGEALILDPSIASIYNDRAMALYVLGDNNEALDDVNMSMALDPGNAGVIDTRAHVLVALGRWYEGLSEFERAMKIGGVEFVRMYQEALTGHGHYSDAISGTYDPVTWAALTACLKAGCRLLE
jgi:tetratricopeptide (TPR) repeat protein